MTTREVTDKAEWNDFVLTHAPRSGAFLQSWEWGEFQAAFGRHVYRFGLIENERLVGGASLVETPLPMGARYLYCPRGPVLEPSAKGQALGLIERAGRTAGAVFVRIEPIEPLGDKALRRVPEKSPANTILTSLEASEEELLAQMHEKTRYNIRLSERKGVEVILDDPSAFDEAWALFEETAGRGGFRLHPRRYYEEMLATLKDDDCRAFLAIARYEGAVIAATLMIDCAETRTYLHGASGGAHRNVMAPHLLHWKLMQDARAKGLRWYDWWGVSPEGAGEEHPWHGVTRFKLGFGGEREGFPGAFELPLHKGLYAAIDLAKKARGILPRR